MHLKENKIGLIFHRVLLIFHRLLYFNEIALRNEKKNLYIITVVLHCSLSIS